MIITAELLSEPLGLTGIRCVLPGDREVIQLTHRHTPIYDLARKLVERGLGEHELQTFTPTGTQTISGQIAHLATLAVREDTKVGPRLVKYRSFDRSQIAPPGCAVAPRIDAEPTQGTETHPGASPAPLQPSSEPQSASSHTAGSSSD